MVASHRLAFPTRSMNRVERERELSGLALFVLSLIGASELNFHTPTFDRFIVHARPRTGRSGKHK